MSQIIGFFHEKYSFIRISLKVAPHYIYWRWLLLSWWTLYEYLLPSSPWKVLCVFILKSPAVRVFENFSIYTTRASRWVTVTMTKFSRNPILFSASRDTHYKWWYKSWHHKATQSPNLSYQTEYCRGKSLKIASIKQNVY